MSSNDKNLKDKLRARLNRYKLERTSEEGRNYTEDKIKEKLENNPNRDEKKRLKKELKILEEIQNKVEENTFKNIE